MSKHYQVRVGKFNVVGFANAADATDFQRRRGGKIEVLENGVTVNVPEDAGKGPQVSIAESSSFPTPSPGLCSLLGLPVTALREPKLIEAAWRANGNKSSPRDTNAILRGLVDYLRTQRAATIDSAMAYLRENFPLLFASALAKTAGTTATAS
jgi:hypothetical protein